MAQFRCPCEDGWVCEQHPYLGWPHKLGLTQIDCGGPGMPCNFPEHSGMTAAAPFIGTWAAYQPRPLPVWAMEMPRAFAVKTLEGIMEGQAGDYLVEGTHGEFYPVKAEIFRHKYNPLDARVVTTPESGMQRTIRALGSLTWLEGVKDNKGSTDDNSC